MCLVRCGSAPLAVRCDEALLSACEALSKGAPELVRLDGTGLPIRVGRPVLEAWGAFSGGVVTVMPPGEWVNGRRLTPEAVGVIVAHEIGHALGLPHTALGLMRAEVDGTCIGREAECLREALDGR